MREVFETTKKGIYACPINMKDEILQAGGKEFKTGRKWFYFKATFLEITKCPMPLSLVIGYDEVEAVNQFLR